MVRRNVQSLGDFTLISTCSSPPDGVSSAAGTSAVSRNTQGVHESKQSPIPLFGDFDITDATDESLLQRQLTFGGQLVGERDDFAVERSLDGGFQVDGWVQSGELCRVEQAVHQRRDLGAVFRA